MLMMSVVIASFQRPVHLLRCLAGILRQTIVPDEVIVIWQQDDLATRDAAIGLSPKFKGRLKLIHCSIAGIVPAENLGLENAEGEVVLFIDDDAVPPSDWLAKHLRHYNDRTVGAVGGPAINHYQSGEPFALQIVQKVGRLTWYGKFIGNLNDSALKNGGVPVVTVDGLAGNNMSIRRAGLNEFDNKLRDYWQLFELEACLQVKTAGFRILFDFENPVFHYPASKNKVYEGTREGDLTQKIFNGAYNHAYILSKHTHNALRYVRLFYLMVIGSVPFPGVVKYSLSAWRYGRPGRELRILVGTAAANWKGWRDGRDASRKYL